MYAAALGREEILHTLLQMKPDLCARNSCEQTVLMIAASYGHVPIIRLLKDHAAHRAATTVTTEDKFEVFRKIIGMDLVDASGFTALHFAAHYNHQNAVQYLLKYGANPNIPDNQGMTPTLLACEDEVQQMCLPDLIKAGGNLSLKNKDGKSGFDIGHRENLQTLVSKLSNEVPKPANTYGSF